MTKSYRIAAASIFTAVLLVGCSDSDSTQVQVNEQSSEVATSETSKVLSTLNDALALRLQRELARGIEYIPGSMSLSSDTSERSSSGSFRASVKYTDETYVEVSPEEVLKELQVAKEHADAFIFALRGATVVKGTGIEESERTISGAYSAEWQEPHWEVVEFSVDEAVEPDGFLMSYYRGKRPLVLGSAELELLKELSEKQDSVSTRRLQTPSQREVARVQAMEELRRVRAESGNNSNASQGNR